MVEIPRGLRIASQPSRHPCTSGCGNGLPPRSQHSLAEAELEPRRQVVDRQSYHGSSVVPSVFMASYSLNRPAVAKARRLIDARQYVLDSDWGERQPSADDENAFLKNHSWDEYGEWHLGLTEGANDATKARYVFVFGDFRRIHRTGLIACVYRASEWRHKEVELAAHDLLQHLDRTTA